MEAKVFAPLVVATFTVTAALAGLLGDGLPAVSSLVEPIAAVSAGAVSGLPETFKENKLLLQTCTDDVILKVKGVYMKSDAGNYTSLKNRQLTHSVGGRRSGNGCGSGIDHSTSLKLEHT